MIGFGFAAACTVVCAVLVVATKNLIRSALWLGLALLLTAVLYAMLDASLLAAVQALLYVGGVSVLLIFGVMITRKHDGIVAEAESTSSLGAAFAAGALFLVLAGAIVSTPDLDVVSPQRTVTPQELGKSLVIDHVLAFEAISLLLLIAVVGAIVLARRKDPAPARQEVTSS